MKRLAAAGENRSCVDCGSSPYLGGLRCWDCFVRRCDANMGEHRVHLPVSAGGYAKGCRCRGCRAEHAAQRKAQRQRKVAA